jgi:hypothetical protein
MNEEINNLSRASLDAFNEFYDQVKFYADKEDVSVYTVANFRQIWDKAFVMGALYQQQDFHPLIQGLGEQRNRLQAELDELTKEMENK